MPRLLPSSAAPASLPAGRAPSASRPGLPPPPAAPSPRRPLCLPPPQAGAPAPAAALTELGDVPGHRVVLLAPVQRGGRGAPVALAVPGRSHRARRRRPSAPLAALGSAGPQAGSGPASAAAARPTRPTPRGAGPAPAPSQTPPGGGPAHRRRPRPPPPGRLAIREGWRRWSALPAPPRHARGCRFGVPDIPEAVFCQDVSTSVSVCVVSFYRAWGGVKPSVKPWLGKTCAEMHLIHFLWLQASNGAQTHNTPSTRNSQEKNSDFLIQG